MGAVSNASTNFAPNPEGDAAAVLGRIGDGVYALDRAYRFTFFNDRCERYFGLGREAVLGRSYFEAFPAARGTDLEAALVGAATTGEARQVETVSPLTGVPILLRAFPSPDGLTVVFTDVSDRYRAEQATRRTQDARAKQLEALDAVLAPLQEYVYLFDLEGRFRYVNQPLLDLWGLTLEEAVGRDFFDLGYPPEAAATLQRQIRQAIESGKAVEGETEYTSPAGAVGYYEYAFVPIFAPDGAVESVGGHTRVVTEQRRREAELARLAEESDRRRRLYDTILDNTPDLVYVWGLDHRFVYANASLLGMWRKTWDEAIGKHCLELGYEPWHAEMHDREIEQVVATKRPVRGVVPFDGAYGRRMYDYILVPVIGADGSVEAVAGTTRDVTDLIEVENALRRSEERLKSALDAGRMAHWTWDPATDRIETSDTMDLLFGLPEGETWQTGRQAFDRIHPEDAPAHRAMLDAHLRRREGWHTEFRVVRAPGGEIVWLEERAHVPPGPEGGAVTGLVWDVTARKEAERAVRESEEQLRTVFEEATDDAILLMDAERRLLAWNTGAERICGWTAEEAVGGSGDRIFTPEDRDAGIPDEEARRAAAEGKTPNERWHIGKDGKPFWGSGTMNALCNADGTVRGYLKIFRDATARHEVERKAGEIRAELERRVAERTRELEEAVREAEGFNYSIAHDLRAPLRAIVATASILLEEAGPGLDEEGRQLLVRQTQNAGRLGRLIDELLRLSRLARAEVRRQPLNMTRKAREVAAAESAERPCRIEVQEGMAAEGDPDLVRTLLHNLIGNACKFSPEGGLVEVGQTGSAFWVRDRGVGFDMAYAHKLFLPFERLVSEAEFPGTGIGLANVDRIVRRHGGRVWAESEPGRGATFFFTLGPEG